MWNHDRSLLLSLYTVRIFFIAWLIAALSGYFIVEAYTRSLHITDRFLPILLAAYGCLIFGLFILLHLHSILVHIKENQIFIHENVHALRRISWHCMGIALVSFVASIYHLPYLIVCVAFAFVGLIVRIVKNIIAEAIVLKEENDYTI